MQQPVLCKTILASSFNLVLSGMTGAMMAVTIFINFEGLQYLKLRCSVASGAKEAHAILPGVQPTSLLALVPCTGTPGSVEYYEVASAKDRVTVRDFTMDAFSFNLWTIWKDH